MSLTNLKSSFLDFCKYNRYEKNEKQLELIKDLELFFSSKKPIFNLFSKSNKPNCLYVHGDVGVGKTMILNFVFEKLKISKKRMHFNEFMINFHDFRHKNKVVNSLDIFVKRLKKKYRLLYLDEFQVTNIVDAMILGRLFEKIFEENIKILITSNTKIKNLYKDGLQRDQFKPFISIMKNKAIEKELVFNHDYRKKNKKKLKRIFYPLNEKSNFKINNLFRKFTRDKKREEKILNTKGRKLRIPEFYQDVARFDFKELCEVNVGAEDYINLSKICKVIAIENLPNFNEINSNQQQRFITLIDILYEKKILLIITAENDIDKITSSKKLEKSFKRTISRLHELSSH
tara:strand:- start:233 stop:1267 length:1035 start_codon:yes stop_codon:yes gene_type:complete